MVEYDNILVTLIDFMSYELDIHNIIKEEDYINRDLHIDSLEYTQILCFIESYYNIKLNKKQERKYYRLYKKTVKDVAIYLTTIIREIKYGKTNP